MREGVLLTLTAVTAFLLQTTLLPWVFLGRATPDLLLVICVYLGLHRHTVGGVVGSFLLGYLEDAFSGTMRGLNSFGMTTVFLVVYLTSRRLWVDNALSKVVVVFAASLVKTTTILLLLAAFLPIAGWWPGFVRDLLIQGVLAAALSPAVFAVLAQTEEAEDAEGE